MLPPGTPAPDFTLPAAHADGTVSLADYRGRSALLLALFRGLYCPFCRHQMAQLGHTAGKLKSLGVETLGVVAAPPERARAFLRRLPVGLPLACDSELTTHRAYGLGRLERNAEANEMVERAAQQLARALDIPALPGRAREAVDANDGFAVDDTDRADRLRHQIQLTGQFLIDRAGIVRWSNAESAATYASFPSETELLPAAARVG